MVRGDGSKDILSGEERHYIRSHPPDDVMGYMTRYVDGLKQRPAFPSKWAKEHEKRVSDEPDVDETIEPLTEEEVAEHADDDIPTEDGDIPVES